MKRNLLLLSIIMLSMLAITSCSKDSKMAELLERVPEDVDFVAVGDLKTIIESAGGSIEDGKIKLPSYILDEIPSSVFNEFDEFNSSLRNSGIDPDVCAIVGNYKDSYPIYIFSISDKKKFTNAIEDEGFREKSNENSTVIYTKKVYESSSGDYDDFDYIAIKDSYAYWIERVWVGSDFKPIRAIEHLIDDASESSYSKTTFSDYITSGNAAGASFRIPRELRQELRKSGVSSSVIDQYEGVICLKGFLDNDQMTIDIKWFGEDGKAKTLKDFNNTINLKAKISSEALAYLGKDEALVFAMSLQNFDWDNYSELAAETAGLSRSERATLSVIKSYLEKIDGTIALGIGLTNGLESIFDISLGKNPLSQFAYTLVIDTKEGKAKGLMNDFKGMMEATGIPFDENTRGVTLEIPGEGTMIYAEAENNHIVISNHKIRKGNDNVAAKSFNFNEYIAATVFSMNRNNKLLRDLSVGNDIQLTMATNAENFESTLKLEVKGGKSQGIIAKVAKIILDVANQEKSLETKWRRHREEVTGYYNYYDEDSAVVEDVIDSVAADTAMVVEDW